MTPIVVASDARQPDGIPFEEKMAAPSAKLVEQSAEADQLEATIRINFEVFGYGEKKHNHSSG